MLSSRCGYIGELLQINKNSVIQFEEEEEILRHPYLAFYHFIEFLYTNSVHRFAGNVEFPYENLPENVCETSIIN